MNQKPIARNAMHTFLCAGLVAMAGCNQPAAPSQPPAAAASTPAPAQTTASNQQPAYTPPSAEQLYQMVAPIALFPDKLVAQVLAGSTYPDQINAADTEVDQNPNLKGEPLQTAIAQQPWDPSVKGLTVFPSVLDQMAKNIDWTTALGEAYVNDPTDVMNAIQVMRQRASSHGSLRSSNQLRVETQTATAQPVSYAPDPNDPVYSGPSVIQPPAQIIEIQPAEQDTVYVPQYNPEVVYGDEVPYYPGYSYERPREYSGVDVLAVGAIGFGAGILVGALFEHHHDRESYGWNNWSMNWGRRGGDGGYRGNNGGNYGGGQRPAVVYNNNTYISRSNTVVNHYVDNHNNNSRTTVNNINNSHNQVVQNHDVGNSTVNNRPSNAVPAVAANGRPNNFANRGNQATPNFGANPAQHVAQGQHPNAVVPNPTARPNAVAAHAPMSMPHFNGATQRGVTTAQNQHTPEHGAAGVTHASVPHVMPNGAQNHEAINHPNAPNQHAQVPQAQRHPAVQSHVAERPPTAVAHYTQPAHVNQPERQAPAQHKAPARPIQAPRPTEAAVRPIQAPRPMAVVHQQPAPRPQQQQQPHNGGGHPAPHAVPSHKDQKHDHG